MTLAPCPSTLAYVESLALRRPAAPALWEWPLRLSYAELDRMLRELRRGIAWSWRVQGATGRGRRAGCSPGEVLRDWKSPNPQSTQTGAPDEHP